MYLEADKVLPRPRLNVLMPRLGLNVKLRYSITLIHSSFCIYVFKTIKTKLHLMYKTAFLEARYCSRLRCLYTRPTN